MNRLTLQLLTVRVFALGQTSLNKTGKSRWQGFLPLMAAIALLTLFIPLAVQAQVPSLLSGTTGRQTPHLLFPGMLSTDREGCFHYYGNQWHEVSCLGVPEKNRFPHPEWQFSVVSDPKPAPVNLSFPVEFSVPFYIGGVDLTFHGLTALGIPLPISVTDSGLGDGAFSIQANTNFFTGNNKHNDWVQFVDQSEPGYADGICIWQIDVTTQDYSQRACVPAQQDRSRGIADTDYAQVGGMIIPGNPSLLALAAYLPWAGGWHSVVVQDKFGLAGNWTELSGSVMGFGSRSKATFGKGTTVDTLVWATSCPPSAPIQQLQCMVDPQTQSWMQLSAHGRASYSGVTAESNNLVPINGTPPGSEPPLVCTGNDCRIQYSSRVQ